MGAQFTIPLIEVIPGQLIASALWNNEWNNLNTNFIPAGMDSYSDTDGQMQIQTNPFPGSVTSHATSLGGEIERIRWQLAQIMFGNSISGYWYQPVPMALEGVSLAIVPVGGVIDYPVSTPPSFYYALANGQAISRSIYPTLFSLIGTTFGIGDGSTTFNIPNYTDRMSITAGNLYAAGETGGAVTHTLAVSEIPAGLTVTDPSHNHIQNAHNHGITDTGHLHGEAGMPVANIDSSPPNTVLPYYQASTLINTQVASNTAPSTTGISLNSATPTNNSSATGISVGGGGGSHNILNPYISMFKMMRIQ